MRDRWDTGRLEAFSDGVFAIAITLLVLEIGVPESDFEHLWKGIADQWPSYLAYATSFLTIGGLWLAHHGIFRRLASADGVVMGLNILLLMLVAFLPFPTKLVAEAIHLTAGEAARHRDLLEQSVTDEEVTAMTQLMTPGIGFYVVVVLLAVLAPQVAAFGFLLIGVVGVFRQRGDRTAASAAS
jgi:uncharacterized membrane protein